MNATGSFTKNIATALAAGSAAFVFTLASADIAMADSPTDTALGYNALGMVTSGVDDSAFGAGALAFDTTGSNNTAVGLGALEHNTTGNFNTATGVSALETNGSNAYNTATGFEALKAATADDNTATGALSLHATTTGFWNTATGVSALYSNTTGYYNVASGVSALTYNISGHDNVAEGFQALLNNKGSSNIGIGSNAGANLTTGNNNIVIGAGVLGTAGESNSTRIGKSTQTKTLISGIYGKTVASGTKVGVMIDSTGKLGTVVSSARYKDNIKLMDKASDALLKLEPVTFRYKRDLDPDGVTQFGLIAEQVEKVSPDLIVRDEEGKAMTVRYEAVNAMLLNEFLKEHQKVTEQQSTISELKATVAEQQNAFASKFAQQQKQIEALSAGLQKVTTAIELNKSAPTQVADNH